MRTLLRVFTSRPRATLLLVMAVVAAFAIALSDLLTPAASTSVAAPAVTATQALVPAAAPAEISPARQALIAERERFITKKAASESNGGVIVAVAPGGEPALSARLSAALAADYQRQGHRATTAVFTPAFFAEYFDQVMAGQSAPLKQLDLLEHAERFVFARANFAPARPSGTADFITVDGALDLLVFDGHGAIVLQKTYNVPGAGLNESAARNAALERLIGMATEKSGE